MYTYCAFQARLALNLLLTQINVWFEQIAS